MVVGYPPRVLLRPARTPEDCRLIWEWACDPDTLQATRDPSPPSWETHVAWFGRDDPNRSLLMALTDDGVPFGEIRFDRQARDPRAATVSVNVAPEHRRKGLGTDLIRTATERYLRELGPEGRVDAWVKESNVASIRAFESAGYLEQARTSGEVVLSASNTER
jgi:RimJ/RimL family protein N-acetyltransferase